LPIGIVVVQGLPLVTYWYSGRTRVTSGYLLVKWSYKGYLWLPIGIVVVQGLILVTFRYEGYLWSLVEVVFYKSVPFGAMDIKRHTIF
jgi:hypothetical protein